MSNLLEVCELAWRQLFPAGSDETKIKKEEFIASGRSEFAYQLWLKILADKREDGAVEIPSYLLVEKELEIVNNVMDISGLKIMRSIPWETWLQKIGPMDCECRYVKSTLNLSQVLCDDDSLADGDKTFYAVGKKIKFPLGVHKSPLPITYVSAGEKIEDTVEVDDAIAGLVRRTLIELYAGKIGAEDKTNNTNSDR